MSQIEISSRDTRARTHMRGGDTLKIHARHKISSLVFFLFLAGFIATTRCPRDLNFPSRQKNYVASSCKFCSFCEGIFWTKRSMRTALPSYYTFLENDSKMTSPGSMCSRVKHFPLGKCSLIKHA